MSRASQTKMQFASWITKGRWKPLLDWFNQNDPSPDPWKTLFEEAQKYDFQQKWPHYVEFFEKHMEHKSGRSLPLMGYSGAQERAWKLLDVAMPAFFSKVAPLLSAEQRIEFRQKAREWLDPWLPKKGDPQSLNARNWVVTSFAFMASMDAFDEWKTIEPLIHSNHNHISSFVKHTLGKDLRWANTLRDVHFAGGGSPAQWRVALLDADCVVHLLAEPIDLPVSRALLDAVSKEQSNRNIKGEDALASVYKRHPHLRVWAEQARGDDAQTCRAIIGLAEVESTKCTAAKTIDIGKSLGLAFNEFAALLDAPAQPQVSMAIDSQVFEDTSFSQ